MSAWDRPMSADRYGSIEYKYEYCLDKAFGQVFNHQQMQRLELGQQRKIHKLMVAHLAELVRLMYRGTYAIKEIRDDEGKV